MDKLPNKPLQQILQYLSATDALHLACTSVRVLARVRSLETVGHFGQDNNATLATQRKAVGVARVMKDTLDTHVMRMLGLCCAVCGDVCVDDIEKVLKHAYSDIAHARTYKRPAASVTQWQCPLQCNSTPSILCSQLCGAPSTSLVACVDHAQCTDTGTHGCVFCFESNGAAMEGDGGVWECMAGLDSDDGGGSGSDEDALEDSDADGDVFGESWGAGKKAGSSSASFLSGLGVPSFTSINSKRRKLASQSSDDVDANAVSAIERKRREREQETKWWGAAAKKCRARESDKYECICGECDLFKEALGSEDKEEEELGFDDEAADGNSHDES
ncbi:hypothetical protein HDU77_009234 [Chytriomyces hyalinus]|nr:hypothetical protein HDU77_009234 [Chytriomyces hyalinus]